MTPVASTPGSVRFTTYNLLNLFAADTAEARQHYEAIAGVIRALGRWRTLSRVVTAHI